MFSEIYRYVQQCLANNDGEASKIGSFPFRKRSEHIWRVFTWAKRIIDAGLETQVDRKSTLIAALFHDVGYAVSTNGFQHAEHSAEIFRQYAKDNNYDTEQAEFIAFLIRNHSNKDALHSDETPLELVILMEADLLDETGALAIVWDCMMEGGQSEQSFIKTYRHIKEFSSRVLDYNPMRTEQAKEFWTEKQEMVQCFIKQLAYDLDTDE